MREILFRGKSKHTDEWVQGSFCEPCNICFETIGDDPITGEKNTTLWDDHAVYPESVGQFVGIVDKHGKKIFEGDVILHHLSFQGQQNCQVGKIYWDTERCAFLCTPGCKLLTSACHVSYEVIGNVFDSPELAGESYEH